MRRSLAAWGLAAAVAACGFPPGPVRAAEPEAYPARPVRIIVGFAAGGIADALARIVGEKLGAAWNQQVIVENRTGAQGNIAMSAVAKSPPDGLTLALVPVGNATVNPTLFATLPYDMDKDFAPITLIAHVENVLVVGAGSPIRTIADLAAAAKASPGGLTYASPGAGSLHHLGAELLARGLGISLRHVPYRGTAPALTDVLRGEVTMTLAQISTAKPFIEAGQLRALGVASPRRSPALPEVPTLAEAANLPGFEAVSWYGLMAPAGTPAPILAKIQAETARLLRQPALRSALEGQGATPVGGTAAEFAAVIAADSARWGKVVREAGIKVE